MNKSESVYVIYIRTTPQKLWQALIDPAFTRRWWCEGACEVHNRLNSDIQLTICNI